VTEDGERFGTPVYMSPEQLLSSTDVDVRSDIWALGVVLFELLTASMPFAGNLMPQLCANILASAPTPLRARCPEASPELEAILLKCLSKDPAGRYRNVAELAQELVPFGLPTSHQLLESIKLAVRFGGASIRPPSRSSGSYGSGTSDRPGVQASDGPVPDLPSFVALKVELNPSAPPAAPRPRRSRLIAAALASFTALSLVGLWGAREVSSRSSARPGSVGLVADPPPSASGLLTAELAAGAAPRAIAPPPDRAPAQARDAPSADDLAARPRPPKPSGSARPSPARSASAVTTVGAPAAAPTTEARPASGGTDYAEFGERR
jgi:serine/threonine-protein kinase